MLWTPPTALHTHAHLLSLFRTPAVASQAPPSPRVPSPAPSLQPSSSLSKQRSSTLGYLLEGRVLSYQQQPLQHSGLHHAAPSVRSWVQAQLSLPFHFCCCCFSYSTCTLTLAASASFAACFVRSTPGHSFRA